MKKKALKQLKEFVYNSEYSPKKSRDLKAVSVVQNSPVNGNDSIENLVHCTEWDNGEGFDFSFSQFNGYTKQTHEKHVSLCLEDIECLLSCLIEMNYFNE